MAAQVQHLTDTVDATTSQVSTNLDFAVDAMQQIRDELNGRIDAWQNRYLPQIRVVMPRIRGATAIQAPPQTSHSLRGQVVQTRKK